MAVLLEVTQSPSLRVDREKGIIFGVRVLGLKSKNNREYESRAADDAATMYEGHSVNYNHPSRDNLDRERLVEERAGWLQNVARDSDGGRSAELHLLTSDPRSAKIMEAAEKRPELFGLSHHVEGETRQGDGKTIVTKITRVVSVDIVTDPATTRSLFESWERKPVKTIKQIVESYKGTNALVPNLKRLVEADAVMAEMPVDAPVEDPNAEIAMAFEKAAGSILKKIFAGDMDVAEGVKKIKELVGQKDKAAGESGSSAADAAASAAGGATMESLQRELGRLKAEGEARDLLESVGVKSDPVKIRAVAALPVADRQALVESWKGLASGGQGEKPESLPRRMTESASGKVPADAESFARSIR